MPSRYDPARFAVAKPGEQKMTHPLARRSLLGAIAAAGALAVVGCTRAAVASRPFFERVGLPIGLQTYTLGDEAGRDLDATFAQVAGIGFREVELPNLYGQTPAAVRAAADRAGLAISSIHLPARFGGAMPGLSLLSDKAQIAESLQALGAKRAVLPLAPLPEGFRPAAGEGIQAAIGRVFGQAGADLWQRTAALLNDRGAALKPLGIALGYHNHNVEFAPIGTSNGWDILVRETDPALVHFEVDTGWVAAAGLDPVTFLRQHRGRVAQLHMKDVAAGNTTNYVLAMNPAEVGSGTLDWAEILPAAHAAGVRHFYVEQEPPFTIPRIEAARKSHDFLARLRA
jgi:sugar phosphate isomerase/epimerase